MPFFEIAQTVRLEKWPGDGGPSGRLLAATAMHYNLAFVSADPVFDGIVTRLW